MEFLHPQKVLYVHVYVEYLDSEAWNNDFVLLKRWKIRVRGKKISDIIR